MQAIGVSASPPRSTHAHKPRLHALNSQDILTRCSHWSIVPYVYVCHTTQLDPRCDTLSSTKRRLTHFSTSHVSISPVPSTPHLPGIRRGTPTCADACSREAPLCFRARHAGTVCDISLAPPPSATHINPPKPLSRDMMRPPGFVTRRIS